ncbi:MAG: hypothetical protein NW200_15205 [Hyphomonadaceae bacterium]|nr:hypothetical protein [Hyphomonadaceae bacterium]
MNKSSIIALAGGGILVALLLGAFLVTTGNGASAGKSDSAGIALPAKVNTAEASAWAEAHATDTQGAYRTYLAAFPDGAFTAEANQAIGRLTAEAEAKEQAKPAAPVRVAAAAGPSRATIRAQCRQYVDSVLPPPSKTTRTVGGAAAGCAVGALAGGNDGRNCAIGAVAGGATGYVTANNREARRTREYETCVANGGPGR